MNTYKAKLKGNRIIWEDTPPEQSLTEAEIPVLITILRQNEPESRKTASGPKMAEILERLAETGGVQGISDPVLWQKETRKDRKLPLGKNTV
jgi:hypothetical protein